MSIAYRVLFAETAPALPAFLLQLPALAVHHCTLAPLAEDWMITDEAQELVIIVSFDEEADYLDFNFGPYHYKSSWYIQIDKFNTLLAQKLIIDMLRQLALQRAGDPLLSFQGDSITALQENNRLYLNALSSSWDKPESLAALAPVSYSFAEYP